MPGYDGAGVAHAPGGVGVLRLGEERDVFPVNIAVGELGMPGRGRISISSQIEI